jgi:CubicO group peptidase (beta-lactamase class C family)
MSVTTHAARFLVLIAASIATATAAQSDVEQRLKHIEEGLLPAVLITGETPSPVKLADRMAELHVPGVSVAVIHEGKIEWARGFGVTKVGGPPVTPDTLFQAASISKPVAALAVLHLVQTGKLDLDTDVNRYLKSWKVPQNEFTTQRPVTLRQLLSHTGGMTVHGFPGYVSGAPLPSVLQILDGAPPANTAAIRVDTLPASEWRYSGGGYVLSQLLLEDVTGKSFQELMRDSVLKPLGMTASTFEQPLPAARLSNVALPYKGDGTAVPGGPHVYPEQAPAGLWTTPSDLARYAIGIQQALMGKSNRVLTASTAREMLKPGLKNFGIGPRIGGSAPKLYFEHDGGNEGYRCLLVAYNSGDGAVIMTNSDNGSNLIPEILRTIAFHYSWPDFNPPTRTIAKIDPVHFDRLVGSYQVEPHFVVSFSREGTRFMSQATGRAPLEIFPESETAYFAKSFNAQATFQLDDQGRATEVVMRMNGPESRAKRLDDAASAKIAAAFAEQNKRVRDQTPATGAEAALRGLIEGLIKNDPDYSKMSSVFAELTRRQLGSLHARFKQLGAVTSISFKRVDPGGSNVFDVGYEKGKDEWTIGFGPDGEIVSAGF